MDLTPGLPEEPVADNLLGQAERHDEDAQGEVGQCQGCHKPILDTLERERTHFQGFLKKVNYIEIRGRIDMRKNFLFAYMLHPKNPYKSLTGLHTHKIPYTLMKN